MCLRTRDNSGHTVIKKPSSSRKTAVTSALKGVQICPYFREYIPSVRTAPFRLRRCKTDHPKALLTGQMEHWWSPERRGPPEGVPHRPHGTLVVAEATWATRRRSSQATMEHWWSPERQVSPAIFKAHTKKVNTKIKRHRENGARGYQPCGLSHQSWL